MDISWKSIPLKKIFVNAINLLRGVDALYLFSPLKKY